MQVAKIPSGGFGVSGANTITWYSDNTNPIKWDSGFNQITAQSLDAGPTNYVVKYRTLAPQDPYYMKGTNIDVDEIYVSISDSNINTSSNNNGNYGNISSVLLTNDTTDNPTVQWLGDAQNADGTLGSSSWHSVNNINTIHRLGNFVPYTG